MSDPASAGPVARLFASGSRLIATVVALLRTRLELLSVELQLEVRWLASMLAWLVVAIQAAMFAFVMAAFWIVLFFWDTHRLLAAGLVTAGFLALAVGAAWRLAWQLRTRPPFLAGTLAELRRDGEQLRGPP